jgi:ferric-dicitrate binding protein FerR (iron transport regulator)
MRFEDTPLWEIIERIEQKFNIRIELQDHKVKQCLVSADLTDQSLATTLKLITQALGGDYLQKGENIQFKIPPCL